MPQPPQSPSSDGADRFGLRLGSTIALLTAVVTVVSLGLGLIAIPISGANCPGDCIAYPYLDTVAQFPRDYLWMPAAMVQLVLFLTLMVTIHHTADAPRQIYSRLALLFAAGASMILIPTYYVQFFVVPVSLMRGQTEGIPLITQYNPHGVFIALEELGYLFMTVSFAWLAPVFTGRTRTETAVRWVFRLAAALAVLAYAAITLAYGLDRQDRFEVVVISVNWLALIVNGFLLNRYFRARLAADH